MVKNKIILDLCGGTGSWSKPWRDAGYTVHVITLPKFDITQTQYDVLDNKWILFCGPDGFAAGEKIYLKDVVGILAAPPCTMFSRARTTAKIPRNFDEGMTTVEACLHIVWACRSHGSLEFWALENPMGYLRQFLGNPAASFRGWEYGDRHVKFTDLWGYFKMPKAIRTKPLKFNNRKFASPKKPARYRHLRLNRAAIRAITPPKFAEAFFNANKI